MRGKYVYCKLQVDECLFVHSSTPLGTRVRVEFTKIGNLLSGMATICAVRLVSSSASGQGDICKRHARNEPVIQCSQRQNYVYAFEFRIKGGVQSPRPLKLLYGGIFSIYRELNCRGVIRCHVMSPLLFVRNSYVCLEIRMLLSRRNTKFSCRRYKPGCLCWGTIEGYLCGDQIWRWKGQH